MPIVPNVPSKHNQTQTRARSQETESQAQTQIHANRTLRDTHKHWRTQ